MLALAATCTADIAIAVVVAIDMEIAEAGCTAVAAVIGSTATAETGRIAEVAEIDGSFEAAAAAD
jgi:hypothetical protein